MKKGNGEEVQPGEALPPVLPPPPPPPAGEEAPKVEKEGKPKPKKGNGEAPGTPCPEDMVPLDDGSCVTPQ